MVKKMKNPMAEWEAAQRAKRDEIRPLYYFAALQAGLPPEILKSIRNDSFFQNCPATRHIGSEAYLHAILFAMTGRSISRNACEASENLEYRGYYESMGIARLGVDITECGHGKFRLTTNRRNTELITSSNDNAEVDKLSLWYVSDLIPQALKKFAAAAKETFNQSAAVSSNDGIYSCEVEVQPGGYVDQVLSHHAHANLIPKGEPDLSQFTIQTMEQLRNGDRLTALQRDKGPDGGKIKR